MKIPAYKLKNKLKQKSNQKPMRLRYKELVKLHSSRSNF